MKSGISYTLCIEQKKSLKNNVKNEMNFSEGI